MTNEFWENQAEKHDSNVKAVNFDIMANDLESFYIEKFIGEPANLIDLGCGNGNTLLYLAKKQPSTEFVGIDSSQNMIDAANKQKDKYKLNNVSFICKDATDDLSEYHNTFNIALTKRLFINIPIEKHLKVIENIYSIVNPWFGKYFMVECFNEPLERINIIRESIGLPVIKVHSFNKYLSQSFFSEIDKWFSVDKKIDFNSFYYFMSRIFNANDSYTSDLNKLAVKISKKHGCLISGFSPEILYMLNLSEPTVFGTCDCLEEVIN